MTITLLRQEYARVSGIALKEDSSLGINTSADLALITAVTALFHPITLVPLLHALLIIAHKLIEGATGHELLHIQHESTEGNYDQQRTVYFPHVQWACC